MEANVSYDKPTNAQFGNYQALFDYFNDALFDGELPPIILNFSRKGENNGGFFAPERWMDGEAVCTHEISINPDHWAYKDNPKHIVDVLVHEMAHLWQHVHGKPPRSGYHNKEWGAKMKEIGLYPSNTAAEGGKETGQQMSHYIIEGGRFQVALDDMPPELLLPFTSMPVGEKLSKAKQKIKYVCDGCGAKVWGKPNMNVRCGDCDGDYTENEI